MNSIIEQARSVDADWLCGVLPRLMFADAEWVAVLDAGELRPALVVSGPTGEAERIERWLA
jgi:hypothetical protein